MIYRDPPLPCPRCATGLTLTAPTWWCLGCKGVWLTRAELLELVRRMAPDIHPAAELPIGARETLAPLTCPHGREPLVPGRLGDVAIDHCEHGVWFDGEELAGALHRIGEWYATRERGRRRGNKPPGPIWNPSDNGHETFGEMMRHVIRRVLRIPPEP